MPEGDDVTLSPEEKATRERDRLIETAKQYGASSYCRKFVAPLFQRMIRAEAGAHPGRYAPAVVDGVVMQVARKNGQCVCVTCGKVDWWDSGIKGMHTGHFLASRRNSILLEELNCAPQCSNCNFYQSGRASEFRAWMLKMRGLDVIERLERLKTTSVTFGRDELVDMRIKFNRRLKAAESKMKGEP
jgi:hypothetical protein